MEQLPENDFTLEMFLQQWDNYIEKLKKSGKMLMSSLMFMCRPKLERCKIQLEFPNEGSQLSFNEGKTELLKFLRKKLQNYSIDFEITVNQTIEVKRLYTPEDKYIHFKEINPSMELLKQTFDLQVKY